MKKVLFFFLMLMLGSTWIACNSTDKKSTNNEDDLESEEAIRKMEEEEIGKQQGLSRSDSVLIQAYKDDKTTISIDDLNKNISYSAMAKILYINGNQKLAAVLGIMSKGMGEIIIQKEGGKAIKLPQTKANGLFATYSDGKTTVETKEDELILNIDGKTETYKKIQ